MNEYHTFSGESESFEKLALTEDEADTITELGLTPEDLFNLLNGPHLAEGSYALIFELPDSNSQLIAKAWKNPKNDSERAANENVALRLLRIRDFKNAPKLKGYLESSKILFEEKIEGAPIEQFDKDIIERLAVALANLHSIKLNKYGKPLAERKRGTRLDYLRDGTETLRGIASSFSDQPDTIELINQLLDKMENQAAEAGDAFSDTNFTLIHFDLNKGNILYSKKEERLALVDWEQASAGDNAMDIAKLFFKSKFDSDQKQEFLTQYESHLKGKDLSLQDRIQVYESFVLVNSILWRLGVLKNEPQQRSSESEKKFYNNVKINLDKELETLEESL